MGTVAEAFCVSIQFKSVITFPLQHHVSYVPAFLPEEWPPLHNWSFFSFHWSRKIVMKIINAQRIFSLFQFLRKKVCFIDYHGVCACMLHPIPTFESVDTSSQILVWTLFHQRPSQCLFSFLQSLI